MGTAWNFSTVWGGAQLLADEVARRLALANEAISLNLNAKPRVRCGASVSILVESAH